MIKLTEITQDIYNALKRVNGLSVYPIVATEGTRYPYCVFERNSVLPHSTKDGIRSFDVTFNITVVSSTYFEGLKLADEVIETLFKIGGNYTPQLQGCTEEYINEGYLQTLTFSF